MARVAYFDCPAGAAGDMILGALVDAGVSLEVLRAGLAGLPLAGWSLRAREVMKGAFRATKVDVAVDEAAHAHHHRGLAEVVDILGSAGLAARPLARAVEAFTRLADAEARAHGTTRESVHFHDVGAVDAIVDVAGAMVGLELLGVDEVHVSALPVGGGFVDGPHGRIPVPAPGTAELLRGFPVVDTGVRAELLTPTGAAILTTVARGAGRWPAMTVERVGYGAGTRDLAETPNVLRCLVGETAPVPGEETVVQLETTIDDMSPQLYEPLMDRLLAGGALDAFLTPVIMKRGRPGTVLSVLCPPGAVEALARVLFEESTTIGVRWDERRRLTLARETVRVDTALGPVPVKVSRLGGRVLTVTPEFADVARLARERAVPVREALDQARTAARRLLDA